MIRVFHCPLTVEQESKIKNFKALKKIEDENAETRESNIFSFFFTETVSAEGDRQPNFNFQNSVDLSSYNYIVTSEHDRFKFASSVLKTVTGYVFSVDLQKKTFLGSCFFYSNRHYLLTCEHLVKECCHGQLFSSFPSLSKFDYKLTVGWTRGMILPF
jgi:hypothetical protein